MASSFCDKVYCRIECIPKGRVTTYKEIAKSLDVKAYRAIGQALKKNPFAPKIPCHRVVRSNGELGGYSAKGGISKKINLLKAEGIKIKKNRILNFEEIMYEFK